MWIGRSKITLFQLFFLSFSYVFSGLFLIGERSFLPMLVPLFALLLFSLLGYIFLEYAPRTFAEKGRFLSFLSMGRPHFFAKFFAVLLLLTAAAEGLLSVIAFAFSVWKFSAFIPFWFVFALLFLLVLFIAWHGLTAVGRFSELMAFLILPILFWLVFWDFKPMATGAFFGNVYAYFIVTPAPILYLFSMTVSESTASPKPISTKCFPLICFFGGCAAVLCTVLFRLYGASDSNIFFLFFGWMASAIRMGMLFCVRM